MKSVAIKIVIVSAILIVLFAVNITAQTTSFTYQGRLSDSGMPSGTYDLQFTLYNEMNAPIGTMTVEDVPVTNGVFTVQLDFTAALFPGATRSLEIAVRRGTEVGAFTTLTPRQPITSSPYAIRSLNATTADLATNATNAANATTATNATNAENLGNVAASNYVQTNSTAFISNQTTQQIGSFNIDGTGTANIFNVGVQFNIGGSRILSNTGTQNLFAGIGAGNANTGAQNSFFGRDAGISNTTGANNTIIGQGANVGSDALTFATALGSGAVVSTSNTIALGRTNGSDKVRIFGLGADGSTSLCRNANNEISTCTTGNFAEQSQADAQMMKTQIESQQQQIDAQAKQLAEQKALIDALRKLVCAANPAAEVCVGQK